LDTTALPGGMIPIVTFSAGLFLLLSAMVALRVGDSVTAAIFGVFSAFWPSFGVLLMALNNGWIIDAGTGQALSTEQVGSIQSTYLLSFALVFVLLTLATLRLPLMFTIGFVLVDITFVLAYIGVTAGNAGLF
ncbi:acetate uptake transporter family protein, partial [Escherichia coli]|uniref:GPR1/FUN34/YaaH family transporter n=1 Tax=Escherichia coli TaxID=562 RepID=UPI00265BDC14